MVFLRIHGERFEVSETALERCGSDSMLVQATAHEGEKLNWPFSVAAFSKVLEWANTGELPQAGSLPQAKMAEICRALIFLNVQADARDTSGPVSQLLAMTHPPSFSDEIQNYSLVLDEAMFFVEIKPYTFSQRARAAGVPLPLPPGCQGLRYIPFNGLAKADGNDLLAELEQQLSHDQWEPVPERVELWSSLLDLLKQRPDLKTVLTPPEELEAQIQMQPLGDRPPGLVAAEKPKLFRDADAFREAVEELLPREARILLDAGLVLAGGFLGRIGAWLAGLCDKPPTADAKKATCDIDFFPLGTPEEALQSVRRALIALAKDCESTETGMFVVRSPHALTIGMDDCCFDLQIVLCTAETPADILAKFDIDASRLAYTPTRQLIASETAIRALLSGTLVAQPAFQGANFADRLHKYATQLGLTVALEHESSVIRPDGKPSARSGAVQLRLDQLEEDWHGGVEKIALKSHPKTVVDQIEREEKQYQGCQVLKEWEDEEFESWWDDEEEEGEEEEMEWTDRFSAHKHLTEPSFSADTGPAWAPNRAEPVMISIKPQHKRLMRELAKPSEGYSGSARTVVEVWRRQRRRGEQSQYSHAFWRMDYQQMRALEESSGLTARRDGAYNETYPNPYFPNDPPTQSHLLNDVVFQQLDAHPKRGNWSECRGHLATASADEPLKFFDFIEDAARVLPPKCRPKLSRCMTIATPDNPIFNLAKRVEGWFG